MKRSGPSRGISLYLNQGIAEEAELLKVWDALIGNGRPQDLFRRLLLNGFREALSEGELPPEAERAINAQKIRSRHPRPAAWSPHSGPRLRAKPRGKPFTRHQGEVSVIPAPSVIPPLAVEEPVVQTVPTVVPKPGRKLQPMMG